MSDHLSLFDIERGLHDLMGAWQDASTPEEIESAEVAIRAYAELEVKRVDGIRRYLRACDAQAAAAKAEMVAQAQRVRMWEARRDRLKAFAFDAMQSFGVKKLEGTTGSLAIRGNGGKQCLTITDPSMVPDELCDVTVTMPWDTWQVLIEWTGVELKNDVRIGPRAPRNEAIRAELESDKPVAGARLEARGESLVVR